MRRIAVTGMGVIAPGGSTPAAFFDSLLAGRSSIAAISGVDYDRLQAPVAASARFDCTQHFAPARLRMLDRVSQLAISAAAQAVADAGLELAAHDRSRCGVFIGTGMGGSQTTDDGYRVVYAERSDRVKPFTVLMAMNNAPAAWIALEYELTGPSLTWSTACSSSAVAIGEAGRRIASGDADIMIAGGTEAPLAFGTIKAWEALHTLASRDPDDPATSCKPFSRNRSGMVLGEGAAVVVLEEWDQTIARGVAIHAELVGYGLSTDIGHITRPTAAGQAAAMTLALASAGLAPAAIGYINALGTGTPANDAVETAAIKAAFAQHAHRLAISSTKSMHGHLLGAAGALEFIVALMAMNAGVVPPTLHLAEADPECDLDYVPDRARRVPQVDAVMSNSFAFGGTNAVLVATRAT